MTACDLGLHFRFCAGRPPRMGTLFVPIVLVGCCTVGFAMGTRSLPLSPPFPSLIDVAPALRQFDCLFRHRSIQLFFVIPPVQSGLLRHSSPTFLHFAAVAFEAGADPAGIDIAVIATNAATMRADVRISRVLHRLAPWHWRRSAIMADILERVRIVRPIDLLNRSIDRVKGATTLRQREVRDGARGPTGVPPWESRTS
jgi:hypothetical protein